MAEPSVSEFIKSIALNIGFDSCGIARADELSEDKAFYHEWLKNGYHGEMQYLERNIERRFDPRLLVPGCRSVLVVLLNYYQEETQQPSDAPKIAQYAWSEVDYHYVVKTKLLQLEQNICSILGRDVVSGKQHIFVDSAPVYERRWAQLAGLGWIGKNHLLISPRIGSYSFIGCLMLNLELDYDIPFASKCGTCSKCIDACPVGALENETFVACKCIAYQTIEKKTGIDNSCIPNLRKYAVGCDICAQVCPWNKKMAKQTPHKEFSVNRSIARFNLSDWMRMTEEDFNENFADSSIRRVGYKRLMENIRLAEAYL